MRIAIIEFVTLDGVSQGPGSAAEATSDRFTRGGWLAPTPDWLNRIESHRVRLRPLERGDADALS